MQNQFLHKAPYRAIRIDLDLHNTPKMGSYKEEEGRFQSTNKLGTWLFLNHYKNYL